MTAPRSKDTRTLEAGSAKAAIGILADIIKVDGVDPVDPEGFIPLDKLLNGTIARVARWSDYSSDPANPDRLRVYWKQDEMTIAVHDQLYTPVDVLEIEIPIPATQMNRDGIAWLTYEVNDADTNPDPAPPRKLTIDRSQVPVQKLVEAKFPHATRRGYLNCKTRPELTTGVTVRIAAQTIGAPNDQCVLEWQGYRSLNGRDPVDGTLGKFSKTLSREDLLNGFEMVIPFENHIKPLIDNDSAVVIYRYYRSGRLIGESEPALVKIDQIIPG